MEVNQKPPGILPLALLLIAIAFGCIGSILLAADLQCNSDIEAWAPFYPNGETVSIEYDFVRPRALGETVWIQESTDDEETVRQFYRDNVLKLLDSARTRGLASAEQSIEVDEETGLVRIILISSCGI